uniref:Uncharacterized protein n=1 Tax=Seriola dumerili TaxID=41447 RepID=A0A3B4U3T9_SERDU
YFGDAEVQDAAGFLSDDHKEHLAFLPTVDTLYIPSQIKIRSDLVGEFGRIALEFLRRGSSPKIYEGAASKTLHLSSSHTPHTSSRLLHLC